MWFLTTLCIWFSKYIIGTIYTHLPGSPSEVESDEEGQNTSQDADNSKQTDALEGQEDDEETSDNSDDDDSEDSADSPSDKPVTVEDMIKQVKDTKLSSDVKTPEKMVRNFK